MPNETIRNILSRRSVRAYTSKQISREQLDVILAAARYAPSAMNQQGRHFLVVQGQSNIQAMLEAGGLSGNPFYGAPTVVVAFANPEAAVPAESAALSIGNMLLAAHALGLAGCWIHAVTAIFATDAGKALQQQWGVPDGFIAVGSAALGYRDGEAPAPKPRRESCVTFIS
ncbi:MAG: diguanylate cyclase [Oscillospiraceae bacterium]|jgi:nitroreductase|nr:diguanylate cyclase [Oscillospiraceae bacterium]